MAYEITGIEYGLSRANDAKSYEHLPMTTNIVFVHLLNDFSGSPKVLRDVIDSMSSACLREMQDSMPVLYVGKQGDGILSGVAVRVQKYWYRRSPHRLITLITYIFSQLVLFLKLLGDRSIPADAIVYVNTLLPFGAAVYGRLTGRKVIYHVHEISITPAALKGCLLSVVQRTSSLNLYVSDAHLHMLPITGVPARRIYNALDDAFLRKAKRNVYMCRRDGLFRILMVASLRDYKGIPEFMALASTLLDQSDVRCELVLNDEAAVVNGYFAKRTTPGNLIVHARASDTSVFYARASVLLNLSRVNVWVETFGLTILEAMAYGVPVVVPPVGGPAELVTDGAQGYHVDSRDLEFLRERVLQLQHDADLCMAMSRAGRARAMEFTSDRFAENVQSAVAQVKETVSRR